jgi:Na+/phosphate symporter
MMADKIAEEAGAIRRFGRAVRYYRPAIDAYLEKMNSGELNEVEK